MALNDQPLSGATGFMHALMLLLFLFVFHIRVQWCGFSSINGDTPLCDSLQLSGMTLKGTEGTSHYTI